MNALTQEERNSLIRQKKDIDSLYGFDLREDWTWGEGYAFEARVEAQASGAHVLLLRYPWSGETSFVEADFSIDDERLPSIQNEHDRARREDTLRAAVRDMLQIGDCVKSLSGGYPMANAIFFTLLSLREEYPEEFSFLTPQVEIHMSEEETLHHEDPNYFDLAYFEVDGERLCIPLPLLSDRHARWFLTHGARRPEVAHDRIKRSAPDEAAALDDDLAEIVKYLETLGFDVSSFHYRLPGAPTGRRKPRRGRRPAPISRTGFIKRLQNLGAEVDEDTYDEELYEVWGDPNFEKRYIGAYGESPARTLYRIPTA